VAKTRKKSREELEAELRVLRRARWSEGAASVLKSLIAWAGASVIAYFAYRTVASLAGVSTTANVALQVATDLRVNTALAWLLGGGGFAYGLGQRRLRRKTIERLQDRIRTLEEATDPGRTSSGLTVRGETHPEDRI
jgi:hypothetical protein